MTDRDDYKRLADEAARWAKSNFINVPDARDFARRAELALRAASVKAGEVVAVRPLEWHENLKQGDRVGFVCSEGGVLSYSIMLSKFRVYGVAGDHDGAAEFGSLEAAKAAAQADYEARIRSALVAEAAANAGTMALLSEGRQFIADSGCDEDDQQTNEHRDDLLRRIDTSLAAANQSDGGVKSVPATTTVGLNWELSDETRKHLEEIDRAIVRPGDPRLNQIFGGPSYTPPAPQAVEAVSVEEVERAIVTWADTEELELTIRQVHALTRALLAKFKVVR
jgi:hypothetical protein